MTSYTWSRFAPNAVAHIASTGRYRMPICGARLVAERQVIRDQLPHSKMPVCAKCIRKADQS